MYLRYDTEAINRDIPIKDVIERYAGIRTDRRGNIACPAPDHNDTHPSAKIYEHSNTCHCFSCQENFNPISLVKAYHSELNFPEVCKMLIDDFGLPMEHYSNIEEVRKSQEAFKRNEFADIFPLQQSELKYIGLVNPSNRAKSNYDKTNEAGAVVIPSLQQMWKDDKAAIEKMLLDKCDETKDTMQDEINRLNGIVDKWNSYSVNEQMEIQKTYEAVMKYQNEFISGRIKLTEKQQTGIETMLEKDVVPQRISSVQGEMLYIDNLKQKITSQQEERAKHLAKQKTHAKKQRHDYEKD